ncbi:hypothetical protein SDJN03_15938, partial [Cucurbita argyrosperma subsp. sororia]
MGGEEERETRKNQRKMVRNNFRGERNAIKNREGIGWRRRSPWTSGRTRIRYPACNPSTTALLSAQWPTARTATVDACNNAYPPGPNYYDHESR